MLLEGRCSLRSTEGDSQQQGHGDDVFFKKMVVGVIKRYQKISV